MRNKKAFSSTIELILITALCLAVAVAALSFFTDNLGNLFLKERHYKGLFDRGAE